MGDDMRRTDYKVPNGKSVRAMLLWHKNYTRNSSKEAYDAAQSKLSEYGLGFDTLPSDGIQRPGHIIDSKIGSDGLIGQDHYADLKAAADAAYGKLDALPNKARLVVIFCEFKMTAKGVTVYGAMGANETQVKWNSPLCLVGGNLAADKLTMLHEMGHGAGLNDYTAEAAGKVNFMNDTSDSRSVMYKFQLEKIAGSFFVQ